VANTLDASSGRHRVPIRNDRAARCYWIAAYVPVLSPICLRSSADRSLAPLTGARQPKLHQDWMLILRAAALPQKILEQRSCLSLGFQLQLRCALPETSGWKDRVSATTPAFRLLDRWDRQPRRRDRDHRWQFPRPKNLVRALFEKLISPFPNCNSVEPGRPKRRTGMRIHMRGSKMTFLLNIYG